MDPIVDVERSIPLPFAAPHPPDREVDRRQIPGDREQAIAVTVDADAPPSRAARQPTSLLHSDSVNRAVNVAIAGLALVILAPVLVLVALAVMTTPGPIFYRQTRVGINQRRRGNTAAMYDRRRKDLGGRVFTIYKFRSMRTDAEKSSGAVWARQGDARVTTVGRFIRATRLDELPQLLNVIKGDMNIVGPRPERPRIFLELADVIEDYSLRQRARPGITGWAQVNQSYDACLDDVRSKVRYDLEYLERQSLAEDLRIMLRTVPVMLGKKGGW